MKYRLYMSSPAHSRGKGVPLTRATSSSSYSLAGGILKCSDALRSLLGDPCRVFSGTGQAQSRQMLENFRGVCAESIPDWSGLEGTSELVLSPLPRAGTAPSRAQALSSLLASAPLQGPAQSPWSEQLCPSVCLLLTAPGPRQE